MHTILVDEEMARRAALPACPEVLVPARAGGHAARHLCGWLKRGVWGGLSRRRAVRAAGLLSSARPVDDLCRVQRRSPAIAGLYFGLKAAVLAIVLQALHKVAKRALKGWESVALAIQFIALAVFKMPFPIVITRWRAGWLMAGRFSQQQDKGVAGAGRQAARHSAGRCCYGCCRWSC